MERVSWDTFGGKINEEEEEKEEEAESAENYVISAFRKLREEE